VTPTPSIVLRVRVKVVGIGIVGREGKPGEDILQAVFHI